MAMALNVPGHRLRQQGAARDSGGSFGVKQAVFPYVVLMCLASRKAGPPCEVGRVPPRTSERRRPPRPTPVDALRRAVEGEADDRLSRINLRMWGLFDARRNWRRLPDDGRLTGAYAIDNLLVRIVSC